MSGIFELVKGGFEIVQSAIYTLKLDVMCQNGGPATVFEVDKADLIDQKNPTKANGTNNYRFKNVVPVPTLPEVVNSQAELVEEIGRLCAAIEQYDSADQIRKTDGNLIDRKIHIVPRKENPDGTLSNEPVMSAAQYLTMIVRGGIKLDAQKEMQAPLRAEAEAVIREEKSLLAPLSKPRGRKAVAGVVYDPESELQ
jgi:hypothetical protein